MSDSERPSERLRQGSEPQWGRAVHHRFVDELISGEVADEVLAHYLVQDYQFVDAFTALLGAAVACADRPDSRRVLARQLGVVSGDENDYFDNAFDALGVPSAERTGPQRAAPTQAFIDLMDEVRRSQDYARILAVLTVAEWLYLDWARRADTLPERFEQRDWIVLHNNADFEQWVAWLRAEFDRLGEQGYPTAVVQAFNRAVELELQFFDAAYVTLAPSL
ncbi:thiaminase/transcriptional activator TenA [Kushneria sinocarnis]|uniref:Aminopyrimidine aminohydrolase n=1 Tax=Kushneria sinocarnis TaxID=595502 RepID=A0A420WTY3_9GAMM|nr:TenA family protein [Kushneria sinocarnis]RKQ96852.1 thiaminase/transcriptional activator TenA [Kushneria sinocarnis]